MLKVALKYGVLASVLMTIIFLIYYLIDKNPLFEVFGISWFTLLIFLYFSIREYRDDYNQRILAYWEGMSVGFATYLIYALLFSLFIGVFISWIDFDLVENFIEQRKAGLFENKEKIIEEMGDMHYKGLLNTLEETQFYEIAVDFFIKFVALGLFFTTVISFIMKRKQKT